MALIDDLECIAKIFFGIFSARDNLSLWVIGPSIGQFIAGIRQVLIMIVLLNQIKKIIILFRNSQEGNCVHELGSGWR